MDQQAAGAEDPNKQPKKKSNDDDSKNKKLVCTYLAFFWGLRMYFTVNCTVQAAGQLASALAFCTGHLDVNYSNDI